MNSSSLSKDNNQSDAQGIALVAALILMAVLSVIGATVLKATSTEIGISGNYRRGLEAFYLAEAGIAEGRVRLRGDITSNPQLVEDPTRYYDARWTAYILTSDSWKPADDLTFYKRQTNYVPIRGNQTNSILRVNSVQRNLPYWVKLKHKTEYDAERDGHRPATPHYVDGDGSIRKHTRANPGRVLVYGYPTADALELVEFTNNIPVDGVFPVERVIASASLRGGTATIEVDIVHPPAPHVIAAIYSLNGISLTGPFNVISGDDRCGVSPSKPPIYVRRPSSIDGSALLQGSPSSHQQGHLMVQLGKAIESLKRGAMLITRDQFRVKWGNSSAPVTVLVDSSAQRGDLSISNVTGYGILLLEGDVTVKGPIQWQGLVISSGKITMDGTSGPIHMEGGMWVDQLVDVAGSLNVVYDSCTIKTAILSKPVVVRKWKQVM